MKKRGFSLIELSLVILVLALILGALTQSTRLVKAIRLAKARSVTQSSPVSGMSTVSVWLDATAAKSFTNAESEENAAVTTWKDTSPNKIENNRNNFTNGGALRPLYTKSAIGNLPALKFDGVNDVMGPTQNFTSITNNFTIFVVARPTATHQIDTESNSSSDGTTGQKYLIWAMHGSTLAGAGLSLGTNGLTAYEHGDGYMPPIAVYDDAGSNPKWLGDKGIVISWVVTERQHTLYIDGKLARIGLTSSRSTVFPGDGIGGGVYGYFSGYVGEYIIIDEALKDEDRKPIEDYLGKKWSIKVTP